MRNAQISILSAVNTASQTGTQIDVGQIVSASFAIVNGDVTATGTLKLQFSNDLVVGPRNIFVPTNWSDIPSATSAVAAGVGPGIVIPGMCFSYIRAVYTRASGGSSTIKVLMNVLSV